MKKLWRWKPAPGVLSGQPSDEDDGVSVGVSLEASVVIEAFMKGLCQRLGLGEECPALRVRYYFFTTVRELIMMAYC